MWMAQPRYGYMREARKSMTRVLQIFAYIPEFYVCLQLSHIHFCDAVWYWFSVRLPILISSYPAHSIFAKNPLENESPLFQPHLLVSRLIGLFLPTSISTDAKWCVRYVVLLEPHRKLLWHLDSFGFFALALMFQLKRTKAGTNCCAVFAFPRKKHALQTDKAAAHFHSCTSALFGISSPNVW